jgi:hypothetical protein
MQPFAFLLGIVMGSAVSLAVVLAMVWVTLLFLPEYALQLAQERAPLAEAITIFSLISAASATSLYGELKLRHWRIAAHAATVAFLGAAVWVYWPR